MKNPYKGGGGDDNYKPLAFYVSRISGVPNGFDSFSEGDEHFFTFNLGGEIYLISEGYSSDNGRDNGINSVTNNMPVDARYVRQVHPNGKHYFNLRAGNNQNIATSRWFDSLAEMNTLIARLISGVGAGGQKVEEGTQLQAANRIANIAIAAPPPPADNDGEPKKKRKKRKPAGEKKPKAEKVYVAKGKYLFNDITWDIFRSGNERYYFTFKNTEGKTLFLNADVRGFETQEQAQTVLDQIMIYAPYEANYEGKPTKNGKYFFYILGEEGKKIGKSFFYGTTEAMQTAIGLLLGSEVQRAAAVAGRDGSAAADLKEDDYLAADSYSGATGFHLFPNGDEFYFSFNNSDGKTLLRSEGYSSKAGRDNGLGSVIKNGPTGERWSTGRTPGGKYYYSIKAGNNQEIGQSRHYDSEASMLVDFNWIKGEQSPIGAGSREVNGVCWSAYAWQQRLNKEAAERAAKLAQEEAARKRAQEEADRAARLAREEETRKKAAAAAAAAAVAAAAAQEAARKRAAEEAARKKAQEEADRAARLAREQEARKKAAEAAAQEAARKRAEEEAARKRAAEIAAQEAARKKAQEEADRLARQRAEEEARRKAAAEKARLAAQEAARKKAQEEADRLARQRAEEEARRKAAAEKSRLAAAAAATAAAAAAAAAAVAAAARKKEEEEATILRLEIEAAKKREIEEAAALRAEIEAARKAEEAAAKEAARKKAEAERIARETKAREEEARKKAEAERIARETKAREEAARKKAEAERIARETKAREEAARKKAEAERIARETKAREEAARKKAEAERIARETKAREEAARKKAAEEETRKRAEAERIAREAKVKKEAAEKKRLAALAAGAAALAGVSATTSSSSSSRSIKQTVVSAEAFEEEDDYLPCKEYKGHSLTDKKNNIATFKHENGQYYFALYDAKGDVKLRSEGFGSTKERDEELTGVLRFHDDRSMYKRKQKGKYYMDILYDPTGREVGRSCLQKEGAAPVAVKKEVSKPAVAAVAAATVAGASSISSTKKVVVERTIDEEDDYLPCKEYEGHKISDKPNNVALFKHNNGQFYFVMYDGKGQVRLRSEGFRDAKQRDEELSGVLKYKDDKSMYKRKTKGKFFMDILYDKTGREVGRSCLRSEDPKPAPAPAKAAVATAVATAAAATIITKTTEKKVVKKSTDKEDDYLICREYRNHKVSDKKNKVALFKHKNDQYYFAVYDNKGAVRLRSEGFESAKKRDFELRGVLKNIGNKDRYKRVTRGNVYYDALYDASGREVGRSCLQKEAVAAPAAAAAPIVKKEVVAPVAKKVVAPVAKKVVAPVVAKKAAAAAAGGFNWKWLWLLLIPLILLLGYFLRGCGGAKAVVAPPVTTAPIVPAEAAAPVKKIVAPVAPSCACNGMDSPVFNLPSASTPKVLTRLGTNPEFGYLRDMGKDAFFNRLAGQHKNSRRDKQFLDGIFTNLGYANGFSDVTADKISSVKIASGTVGNIGAGKNHRTLYAKLDVSGRDVEAFRVAGNNGCAIHFMKTCGNHFYYCE